MEEYVYPWTKELRVYLGNIDIRHHLMRQKDPESALEGLMQNYEAELLRMQERGVDKIEIVQALPIENESRPLPKTGYYKGTPFAGSWQERTDLVKTFNWYVNEMGERNGWQVWKHPEVYLNNLDELDFEVMEKPKSVHIARKYYRWDLVADTSNENLKNRVQSTALF